ncbi:MAG: Diaminopimelate epimerase [Chlamydiia bacterium]|nr:Diaminopimelate epimerase [Chlamydiia bacterium]
MKVNFSKFEAAGNDFIMIDDRKEQFPEEDEALVQKLCHRQFGIGADGVILVQNSSRGDYKMRIINADGKEASMCGNGLRCTAGFVADILKKKHSEFLIESLRSVHPCMMLEDEVHTDLGRPILKEFSRHVEVGETSYRVHLIDTGVPHAVMFVNTLEMPDFLTTCRDIRNHPLFYPEGVNVNLAMITPDGVLHIRVYERGVEGETLACGSGAAACSIAAKYIYKLESPVKVVFYSGQELLCHLKEEDGSIASVAVEGPYKHVFDGKLEVDLL